MGVRSKSQAWLEDWAREKTGQIGRADVHSIQSLGQRVVGTNYVIESMSLRRHRVVDLSKCLPRELDKMYI